MSHMSFKDKFILTVAIISAGALLIINANTSDTGVITECGVNISC